MKPIKEFLTEEKIEDLASRSIFRYGKSIAQNAEIAITKSNTFNLVATVKQGDYEPRTVALESTHKGFRWKCSCTSKKNYFCEHAVAAALANLPK